MAVNVISMQYPWSESGVATAGEVASVTPSEIRLSKKAREIAESVGADVKESDDTVSEIKRLDREILHLMSKRDMAVADLERKSWAVVSKVFGYTSDTASKIASKFSEKGFGSKQVRNAVKDVRDALFDDTDSRFREIVCTGVSFDDGDSPELMFKFEHTKTGNCFRIDIPTQSRDSYMRRNDPGIQVYGIGLVFAYNSSCEGAIAYHYDIRVIREQLRLFVERGFEPLDEKRGERWRRWRPSYEEDDTMYWSAKRKYEMTAEDYFMEAR